jgi:hypothetical protein
VRVERITILYLHSLLARSIFECCICYEEALGCSGAAISKCSVFRNPIMSSMLIVTTSLRISVPRCMLLATNFLSNLPDAEVYVADAKRLHDIGRLRLSSAEKLTAARFSLWSDSSCARAASSSAAVIVVLDPLEAGVNGPHKQLFACLGPLTSVFLVASSVDLFRRNARIGDQVLMS